MDGPRDLASAKLLFWPNNPRLKISDFAEVRFTEDELLDARNQRKIFRLLTDTEQHDVRKLVTSMRRSGFMRQMAPVVMKVDGSDRYLVLEGNRRLAAIRTLLADGEKPLPKRTRQTLEAIPCWLFVHNSRQVPLQAAISRMVAEAHIKGQKPHTKLQQAHMLYAAYEGFLLEASGRAEFRNDPDLMAQTADVFGMTYKEIEGEVAVVRLYRQLRSAGFEVPHTAREKLSWVYQNPRHFKNHFGYDKDSFQLDEAGVESFFDLFVAEKAAVSNPARFRKFLEIMRSGNESDVAIIRDEPEELDSVYRRVLDGKSEQEFLSTLLLIEKKIKSLRVSSFRETPDELEAIKNVQNLVQHKLGHLVRGTNRDEPPVERSHGRFKRPTCIGEAIELEHHHVTREIRKILKDRPNTSCVRRKLPDYLLQRWSVRSRGAPRAEFCALVDQVVEEMAKRGEIRVYWATNERVMLP